jgi:DNA relaxase NicK
MGDKPDGMPRRLQRLAESNIGLDIATASEGNKGYFYEVASFLGSLGKIYACYFAYNCKLSAKILQLLIRKQV